MNYSTYFKEKGNAFYFVHFKNKFEFMTRWVLKKPDALSTNILSIF